MTQLQTMTNPELNRALAELMGWTNFKEGGHGIIWGTPPDDRWTNMMPDYAGDPAASLEVQTAAIAANKLGYLNTLLSMVNPFEDIESAYGGKLKVVGYTIDGTSALLLASPRERAEAAYITLSSKR